MSAPTSTDIRALIEEVHQAVADLAGSNAQLDQRLRAAEGKNWALTRLLHSFIRLEILRSTISGNAASLGGGGVGVGGLFPARLASFVLHGSTVAENSTDGVGGGIRFRDYTLADMQSSIVASNTATTSPDLHSGHNPIRRQG